MSKVIKDLVCDAKGSWFRKMYFYLLFEVWGRVYGEVKLERYTLTGFNITEFDLKHFVLAKFIVIAIKHKETMNVSTQ